MAGYDSDDDRKSVKKKSSGRKFTKKTKEYKKLERLFREHKINPNDKPSDVRSKEPEFLSFTTTQFRSQFNKLKAMYGVTSRECKTIAW
jgi:hypothetical protein